MARIQIKDLPKDMKIGKDELKQIKGGAYEFYLESPINQITWKLNTTGLALDGKGRVI